MNENELERTEEREPALEVDESGADAERIDVTAEDQIEEAPAEAEDVEPWEAEVMRRITSLEAERAALLTRIEVLETKDAKREEARKGFFAPITDKKTDDLEKSEDITLDDLYTMKRK